MKGKEKMARKLKFSNVPPGIAWNRVKTVRKVLQLSQLEVAARAGVSPATYRRLEAGEDHRVSRELRGRVVSTFNELLKEGIPGRFNEFDYLYVTLESIFPASMLGDGPHPRYVDDPGSQVEVQ